MVKHLCLETIRVSYADRCPAYDPKTNCPFFQKGNCPEIDCALTHPLSKLLCTNWRFQGMTFPRAVLCLNFSCPEKDKPSKVSHSLLCGPIETAVILFPLPTSSHSLTSEVSHLIWFAFSLPSPQPSQYIFIIPVWLHPPYSLVEWQIASCKHLKWSNSDQFFVFYSQGHLK